ncbi:MAG: DUF87 domain-containing protein [Candidatus Micrarchaeota archaeon]|nr:DUF87 domain-containing protein [Candidatus Micrarchaeota archaeon]
MLWFKKDENTVGEIRSRLSLGRFFAGMPAWRWKRVRFRRLSIDPGRGINPHIVIVGESGSGKSSLCRLIASSIARSGAHVAILDPHNEYLGLAERIGARVYDASYNAINLFDLDGMEEKERASEIMGLCKRIFRLGEVQGYTLYRCIMYTYMVAGSRGRVPNMNDLLFTIKAFRRNAKAGEAAVLEGLERRISLIAGGTSARPASMDKVIGGNSVFLLSKLHTGEAQTVYMEGFLRKVYARMLSLEKSGHARLYIVIDEAGKLGDNPVLGKLAAEGRKYGIGVVAIAQRAKSIDANMRNNASLFISFYQREPEELNYVANFVSGGNELGRFIEVKRAIRNLGRGSAVVLSQSFREPLVVDFDSIEVPATNLEFSIVDASTKAISEGELLRRLRAEGRKSGEIDEVISRLILEGTLQRHAVKSGTEYDGNWYISMQRNSAEHDVCVAIISRHLSSLKIPNRIYNSSYGPDVIAYSNGRKIAIEYETGTKSPEQTGRMVNFRRGAYASVTIVANDRFYAKYLGIDGARIVRLSDILNARSIDILG